MLQECKLLIIQYVFYAGITQADETKFRIRVIYKINWWESFEHLCRRRKFFLVD